MISTKMVNRFQLIWYWGLQ